MQRDWKPAWQISQVLSEATKEPTTNRREAPDVVADLVDDADVLVSHAGGCGDVLDAAVGPQVGAADAGGGDADDRVGGFDDGGDVDLVDADVSGGVHDDSSHRFLVSLLWVTTC